MRRALTSILIFVGLVVALTLVAGLIGWLGVWELVLIAAVAALLTLAIVRSGSRRRGPARAAS